MYPFVKLSSDMCRNTTQRVLPLCLSLLVIFSYALTTECISADCCFYYTKCQFKLSKCLLLKFVQILVILLQDTLSVRCTNWILSAPLVITCSNSI